MADVPFPPFTDQWEPAKATLHAYSQAAMAVNRVAGLAHPQWWHVSFTVRPEGLVTDPVPLPGGGLMALHIDLRRHTIGLDTNTERITEWSMTEGLTSTELGERIISAAADLGITGDYHRDKFENDEPRRYDVAAVRTFHTALVNAFYLLEDHRLRLTGTTGPVQLWPHGFDLAFEWFGTRMESYQEEDGGPTVQLPSQINFGFHPAGEPYFYSNPWPFDPSLTGASLPHDAEWHTEGWKGTIYPYAAVTGDEQAFAKLSEYFQAVSDIASPTLMA